MVILGLTGSIGMGKSTAARILRRMGVPVHDADQTVHELLGRGGAAVHAVEAAFPGVVIDGAVDRGRLGARVFGDPAALARLEVILHPLVRQSARRFLARQARLRAPLVVLDIPLLFETGAERLCDAVAVVSAPRRVQEARVLSRPGMTAERLEAIGRQQLKDQEKRRRADFVISTGLTKRETLRQLARVVTVMRARPGRHWPPPARPRSKRCHAGGGARHGDHGSRSRGGAPGGRDRLPRADQPRAERPQLS